MPDTKQAGSLVDVKMKMGGWKQSSTSGKESLQSHPGLVFRGIA